MRRIVAFDHVSADGYFTTGEGPLDWVVQEPELERLGDRLSGTGTILFGRRTYDMFESFWPHALDDDTTAPNPHARGQRSPEMRAMAVWINEAHKLVWSRTRKELTWKNSRALGEFDPGAVEALKKEPGGDMMVFGSGTIVSLLTAHALVDEYEFVVSPVLLGRGRPLLSGLARATRVELLEARSYPSGNVRLRYGRGR
jgi:dihydrofolate reductase